MKKSIWLSYDLGVKGDYEGLYSWLDGVKAKECGDSLAYLKYPVDDVNELAEVLKADLAEAVEFGKSDRIYIVWKSGNQIKGRFIRGNRKAAPWQGFAGIEVEDDI